MGIYAEDGSINVTVVDGESITGLYAADGSMNVVLSAGDSPVGIHHPCGAMWVTPVTEGVVAWNAADGSVNVAEDPYTATGALKVTVVSGTLTPE